jgi:two-component system, LytTR family, sensor histidine kinase AlgZ
MTDVSLRQFLSLRRVVVTLGVAGTIGFVEWLGLGHPLGLVFGLLMGAMALLVAPLIWLWVLPWGLRPPTAQVLLRAVAVIAISSAFVALWFWLYYLVSERLVPVHRPLIPGVYPNLSSWPSLVVSIPLFIAAGWGLSRHLALERRLEVHDRRELALRGALEEARLLAVQSRLDPHFLFNALNLVAELCREDPLEAERCVLRLSGLLRAVLDQSEQPLIGLGRELDLCVDYLELCRVRFGERLRVEVARDPQAEGARVPFLGVQVLCENAVRHGVERNASGGLRRSAPPLAGLVRITTRRDADRVCVTVESPGSPGPPRAGGMGLELVQRRLALTFPGKAGVELRPTADGSRTIAELWVPA